MPCRAAFAAAAPECKIASVGWIIWESTRWTRFSVADDAKSADVDAADAEALEPWQLRQISHASL